MTIYSIYSIFQLAARLRFTVVPAGTFHQAGEYYDSS